MSSVPFVRMPGSEHCGEGGSGFLRVLIRGTAESIQPVGGSLHQDQSFGVLAELFESVCKVMALVHESPSNHRRQVTTTGPSR